MGACGTESRCAEEGAARARRGEFQARAKDCSDPGAPACDDRAVRVAVAIRELLAHCRELNFGDLPDYAHCKAVLMKAYSAVTGRSELAEEQEWNDPPKPRQSARSAGVDLMDLI